MIRKLTPSSEFYHNMANTEKMKDTLENLSLYLNEIERIINMHPCEATEEEKRYKLQVLERHIADMSDLFKFVSGDNPQRKVTLS